MTQNPRAALFTAAANPASVLDLPGNLRDGVSAPHRAGNGDERKEKSGGNPYSGMNHLRELLNRREVCYSAAFLYSEAKAKLTDATIFAGRSFSGNRTLVPAENRTHKWPLWR